MRLRGFIFILGLFGASAIAQTPATPLKNVIGVVTAIDANAKQITLTAEAGTVYTAKLDEKTLVQALPADEKDASKVVAIQLSDIAVGDRVRARGIVSEEDKTIAATRIVAMAKSGLDKKHEAEHAEWQKRSIVVMADSVNPETKEIAATVRGREQ